MKFEVFLFRVKSMLNYIWSLIKYFGKYYYPRTTSLFTLKYQKCWSKDQNNFEYIFNKVTSKIYLFLYDYLQMLILKLVIIQKGLFIFSQHIQKLILAPSVMMP